MKEKEVMPKYRPYSAKTVHELPQFGKIPENRAKSMKLASRVLPFRVSNYVTDELIDWENVPEDPMFRLTFPQPEMIPYRDMNRLREAVERGDEVAARHVVSEIHMKMNPHPAGQMDLNVPIEDGVVLDGMQHKYAETVLFFPTQGQTCHSFCTYCFRWAQFIGLDDLKFACGDPEQLVRYLDRHPEVTDVLFTGGDPLIMRTGAIRKYVAPLLERRPGNLKSIRFGTKVPAWWPYRFTTDKDADDLMALFSEIVASGIHLSVMSHFTHERELSTVAVEAALRRIRATGAQIRCQAPLVRHINDDPDVWARMWQRQVELGATPYYMFVERDTGPKGYFNVPLAEAYRIFTEAWSKVSGLARTVRGPSMSASPGKILVDGMAEIGGEKVFALKFIQARNPEWVNRLFFAKFDEKAHWLDDLVPAFGEKEFFWEAEYREMKAERMALLTRMAG